AFDAHAWKRREVAALTARRLAPRTMLAVGPARPFAVGVAQPLELLTALRGAEHVAAEQAHVVAGATELAAAEVAARLLARPPVHAAGDQLRRPARRREAREQLARL